MAFFRAATGSHAGSSFWPPSPESSAPFTLAARLQGMTWSDSLALGALMNTRGLMELIVLNIGYDLGMLSPTMYTMMVIMALATTCMAGPALAILGTPRARAEGELVNG